MKERASNWDQPTSEYIDLSERYLGFQQPDSIYGFADAAGGNKRVRTLKSVIPFCSNYLCTKFSSVFPFNYWILCFLNLLCIDKEENLKF